MEKHGKTLAMLMRANTRVNLYIAEIQYKNSNETL
jgi:hypothetical protein